MLDIFLTLDGIDIFFTNSRALERINNRNSVQSAAIDFSNRFTVATKSNGIR